MEKTDAEWRESLTPQQYEVLRKKGTERPFSGKYVNYHGDGMFNCSACGANLFKSDTKFDSGSGWPSFTEAIDSDAVVLTKDRSFGMSRTEVTCKNCGGHLGHVFPDGPGPTGMRYCINSCSLKLDGEAESPKDEN